MPPEESERRAMPTHDHRRAQNHRIVRLERSHPGEGQDVRLQAALGNFLPNRLGDLDGRAGVRGISYQDFFRKRSSSVEK